MTRRTREAAAAAAFAAFLLVPFLTKPYHVDEPLFLAAARHILQDPLHPLDFRFNWYGQTVPMDYINNTPPFFLYMLAGALKLTGGAAWAMRLCFLPFALAAAAGLCLLASLFLENPLLPALIAIASPALCLTLGLLYPEIPALCFGVWALYFLVRAIRDRRFGLLCSSAALMNLALLSKYAAVIFLLPACGLLMEGESRSRPTFPKIAAYLGASILGPTIMALHGFAAGTHAVAAAWAVTAEAARSPWSRWPARLRALLAFAGGCGVVTGLWPLLIRELRPPRGSRAGWISWILAAAAVSWLFRPGFDTLFVTPLDRAFGILWALGGLLSLVLVVARSKRTGKGWELWAPWALSAILLEGCLYWSVIARVMAFFVAPAVLGLAGILESARGGARLRRLYALSLAGTATLSFLLALVDYRYASASKAVAEDIVKTYARPGRTIWCAGHWGLQYYVESMGGRELDFSKGGYSAMKPGDVIVMASVNSGGTPPTGERPSRAPVRLSGRTFLLDTRIPLRLLSGWRGQAGFYSSLYGFLPFTLSREPLEIFRVGQVL